MQTHLEISFLVNCIHIRLFFQNFLICVIEWFILPESWDRQKLTQHLREKTQMVAYLRTKMELEALLLAF